MENVLEAIRFCRETEVPFLGTCGGYQHAALEFARNVLGITDADNAEVNAESKVPLIAPLVCGRVEVTGEINLNADSKISTIYGATRVTEKYHCSYRVNPAYLPRFDDSVMVFSGFDDSDDPRVLELRGHQFFIGTAFQPERSALSGNSHRLVEVFLESALVG